MTVRLQLGAIATASACAIMLSCPASAQNFNDRWSIIPKAHADEAPKQRDNQNQNQPEQPEQPPIRSQPEQPPIASQSERTSADPSSSKALKKTFSGKASFYSYTKGRTASGSPYDREGMTAAHRTLPFGTRIRVTDIASSKSVVVRIVDRGPWIRDRVLDLSLGAARTLGMTDRGVSQVRVEILGPA